MSSQHFTLAVLDYETYLKHLRAVAVREAMLNNIKREWVEYDTWFTKGAYALRDAARQGVRDAFFNLIPGSQILRSAGIGPGQVEKSVMVGEDQIVLDGNAWKADARRLEQRYWTAFIRKCNEKGVPAALAYHKRILRNGRICQDALDRLFTEVSFNNEDAQKTMMEAIRRTSRIKLVFSAIMAVLDGVASFQLGRGPKGLKVVGGGPGAVTAVSTTYSFACTIAKNSEEMSLANAIVLAIPTELINLVKGQGGQGAVIKMGLENLKKEALAGDNLSQARHYEFAGKAMVLLSVAEGVSAAYNEHDKRMEKLAAD